MNFRWTTSQRQVFTQEGGVGYATIDPLPGDTSDIAFIHGVYIPANERRKGIGDLQHKERLAFLKEGGFQFALCTVNNQNEAEVRIVEKNGWEKIKELPYNSIWIKDLRDAEEEVQDVEST